MHLCRCISVSIYYFLKIIGLMPFSMSILESDNSRIFVYSRIGSAYNVILIFLTIAMSFPAIQGFRTATFAYNTSSIVTIGIIKAIVGIIILIIIWGFVCTKQRAALRIANRFSDIDNSMLHYRGIYQLECPSLRVFIIVGVNFVIWINIIWTDIVTFETFLASTLGITIIPNIVFNWLLIQYTLVLVLLEMRFRAVNRGISRLATNYGVVTTERTAIKKLLHIKSVHENLHEISSEVIDLYSFPVLLIVTAMCAAILTTSYYFIMPFLIEDHNLSALNILDSLSYLAMEIFPIVMLSTSVTRVTQEMKLTAGVVHKLLAHSVSDRHLKSELKIFSLELLHRDVQFTGCGIFSLDCTLLHSITNMTATYLVILIQFQKNDQSPSNSIIKNIRIRENISSNTIPLKKEVVSLN